MQTMFMTALRSLGVTPALQTLILPASARLRIAECEMKENQAFDYSLSSDHDPRL